MTYALFCEICKFGSFSNFKIDSFICDECKNNQADRLNPEDTYIPLNDHEGNQKAWKKCWLSVCDSQNSENK